ncbi:metal ABC transporter solute-binding protein, Zn/Mn family [Thermoproteus tenax]|uniref:ABC-type Mn/Zn transport system, periplasmic component n=1 Tax=Thermoproteus tenax (strain ATCC 35583 / DSM 2078 / JCM 9277 / NBRC 100435 / Kra 1) TaxID=768679 RepID=G4RNL3_THETK|nr:ABC transporter substrate-binding protein [Thermoproteus tenax]CCC81157.1 ABC-type Mn/Zn transport system, periplasmic component [Thermoproteus tenax Kra 1]
MIARVVVLGLALLAIAAWATTIVVTFPAYDLYLKEAFPQANVVLLTKGVSDPHEYQLTPSDVQMLLSLGPNDVIVTSLHAQFELRILQMAQSGEIKAKVVVVPQIAQYLTFDGRLVRGNWSEGGVNEHEHGLYVPNAIRIIEAVANATGLSPNQTYLEQLLELNRTYCCKFSGRAVAVTPAAEYILYWLGYRDIVVLIKEEGVPPTPQDLQRAAEYMEEGAPALAVGVSGETLRIAQSLEDKLREMGVSNPHIITAVFNGSYIGTMEQVVEQISQRTQTAQPAQAGSAPGYLLLIIAVTVAVAAAAIAVFKFRRASVH